MFQRLPVCRFDLQIELQQQIAVGFRPGREQRFCPVGVVGGDVRLLVVTAERQARHLLKSRIFR